MEDKQNEPWFEDERLVSSIGKAAMFIALAAALEAIMVFVLVMADSGPARKGAIAGLSLLAGALAVAGFLFARGCKENKQ